MADLITAKEKLAVVGTALAEYEGIDSEALTDARDQYQKAIDTISELEARLPPAKVCHNPDCQHHPVCRFVPSPEGDQATAEDGDQEQGGPKTNFSIKTTPGLGKIGRFKIYGQINATSLPAILDLDREKGSLDGLILISVSGGGFSAVADELDRVLGKVRCPKVFWLDTGFSAACESAMTSGSYIMLDADRGEMGGLGHCFHVCVNGTRPEIIKSTATPHKAPRTDGGPDGYVFDENHLGKLQLDCDKGAEQSIRAIAMGRGVPVDVVMRFYDGRSYGEQDLLEAGLIDAAGTMEEAWRALARMVIKRELRTNRPGHRGRGKTQRRRR